MEGGNCVVPACIEAPRIASGSNDYYVLIKVLSCSGLGFDHSKSLLCPIHPTFILISE